MANKVIYRRPTVSSYLTGMSDNARGAPPAIYEGLVVDVILDHTHPEYSRRDGFNVGAIKVRLFDVNESLEDSQLPYADPLDVTLLQYPLIGELVMIHKIRGNYFYSSTVAIARRLQENAMIGLNKAMNNPTANTLTNAVLNRTEIFNSGNKFGEYFKPDSRVRQLKHFEGDVIIQGRMGNSIRFGSSQMDPSSKGLAPNVIIRAGQGKDIETEAVSIDTVFGLILEDINKDVSSIWLTADQTVPFEPATINAGSFVRSISNPPQAFDKAQVIINSDRVVLNSKSSHIMMFSNEGIHLNSFKETTIDTDNNIILTANLDINFGASGNITSTTDKDYVINSGNDITLMAVGKASIVSEQIFIGTIDKDDEPLVGGASLAEWLDELLAALLPASGIVAITSTGPAKIHPLIKQKLEEVREKLNDKKDAIFNSKNNFVSLENEKSEIVLNEFEEGEPTESINNEWNLSESYYKVK